jgi:hypothetical protein
MAKSNQTKKKNNGNGVRVPVSREMIIKVVLYSAAAPFFVSMVLVWWGLRLRKSE